MTKKQPKIKACPFCGSGGDSVFANGECVRVFQPGVRVFQPGVESWQYWVECGICETRGPRTYNENVSLKKWNNAKR